MPPVRSATAPCLCVLATAILPRRVVTERFDHFMDAASVECLRQAVANQALDIAPADQLALGMLLSMGICGGLP